MSAKQLVDSIRHAAQAAGLSLPLAKSRNAIAFMLFGANYSAVLAAERAGNAHTPYVDERRANEVAARYRFSPDTILNAARAEPLLDRSLIQAPGPRLSDKALELIASAGIHDSKGHTRVLCAAVKGDRIRVFLLGKSTSSGAALHIDYLLRSTKSGQCIAFARMNKHGAVHYWAGRSVLHPDPEPGTGYFPNYYLPDLTEEIDVARRVGTLRLDPLLGGATFVEGVLPLRASSATRGTRDTVTFDAPSPDLEMLGHASAPHELLRLVHLIPEAHRAKATKSVLGHTTPPAKLNALFARDDYEVFQRQLKYYSTLRGLLAPAPQQLPAALLAGTPFVKAWVIAHKGHRDYQTPFNVQFVALIAMTPHGDLHVRRILDSFGLSLLPMALLHDQVDRSVLLDDQLPDLCSLARQQDADSYPRRFYSGYFDTVDAAKTLRSLIAAETDRIADIGRELYASLSPTLRDRFIGVDDYNLLHAAGDASKSVARAQAAASIWGGMGLLLSDTVAGKELLEKVDSRFKLHAAAAKVLGVKRWVVRRLTTTDPAVLNALATDFMGGFVPQFIQWLGPNVRVRTVFDVNKLKEMYSLMVSEYKGNLGQTAINIRFRTGLIGRTVEAVGFDEAVRLVRGARTSGVQAEEVLDYFAFVDRCAEAAFFERASGLNLPSFDNRLLKARLVLFRESNLQDVIRWVSRYHDLLIRLPVAAAIPVQKNKPIPPLLPPSVMPRTGWQVAQLMSYDALAREGAEMEHCVRTYHGRVSAMASAIFTLRGLGEMDRVTVEVSRGSIAGWQLLQARGFQNRTVVPGSPGHVALDEFLEMLERATADSDSALVAAYRKGAQAYVSRPGLSFIDELLESYGTRAWEMIRNTMPGSAHGRIEGKLWEAMIAGNPDTLKQVQLHDRVWNPALVAELAGVAPAALTG